MKDPYKDFASIKTKVGQISLPMKVILSAVPSSLNCSLPRMQGPIPLNFSHTSSCKDSVPTLQCTHYFLLFVVGSNSLQLSPPKDHLHKLPYFLLILDPKLFLERDLFFSSLS